MRDAIKLIVHSGASNIMNARFDMIVSPGTYATGRYGRFSELAEWNDDDLRTGALANLTKAMRACSLRPRLWSFA